MQLNLITCVTDIKLQFYYRCRTGCASLHHSVAGSAPPRRRHQPAAAEGARGAGEREAPGRRACAPRPRSPQEPSGLRPYHRQPGQGDTRVQVDGKF